MKNKKKLHGLLYYKNMANFEVLTLHFYESLTLVSGFSIFSLSIGTLMKVNEKVIQS